MTSPRLQKSTYALLLLAAGLAGGGDCLLRHRRGVRVRLLAKAASLRELRIDGPSGFSSLLPTKRIGKELEEEGFNLRAVDGGHAKDTFAVRRAVAGEFFVVVAAVALSV